MAANQKVCEHSIICKIQVLFLSFTLEVVDLTSSNDVKPTTCNYWIPELNLTVYNKDVITKGAWLMVSVINAGLKLMKEAYPHIEKLF